MRYTAQVDTQKCMGAGTCEQFAPNSFVLNDDLIAEVQTVDGALSNTNEEVLAAARSCPVDAITVTDEQGRVVWPLEDGETPQ